MKTQVSIIVSGLFLVLICLCGFSVSAQVPIGFNYQAVVRDSVGHLVRNQQISLRISLIQGDPNGQSVYQQEEQLVTNDNGLFTTHVGTNAADFVNIDWADGPYFIQSEVDPFGHQNYTLFTVQQLLSVPYAMYAQKAESLANPITEHDPDFHDWNYQYDSLRNSPILLSQFENDSRFLTSDSLRLSIFGDTLCINGQTCVALPIDHSKAIPWDSVISHPTLLSDFVNDRRFLTSDSLRLSIFGDTVVLNNQTRIVLPIDHSKAIPWDSVMNHPSQLSQFANDCRFLTTDSLHLSIVGDTLSLNGHTYVVLPIDHSKSIVWDSVYNRPTSLSQFSNDPGFLTNEYQTLSSVVTLGNEANGQIKSLLNPTDSLDAVNKYYVDSTSRSILDAVDTLSMEYAQFIDSTIVDLDSIKQEVSNLSAKVGEFDNSTHGSIAENILGKRGEPIRTLIDPASTAHPHIIKSNIASNSVYGENAYLSAFPVIEGKAYDVYVAKTKYPSTTAYLACFSSKTNNPLSSGSAFIDGTRVGTINSTTGGQPMTANNLVAPEGAKWLIVAYDNTGSFVDESEPTPYKVYEVSEGERVKGLNERMSDVESSLSQFPSQLNQAIENANAFAQSLNEVELVYNGQLKFGGWNANVLPMNSGVYRIHVERVSGEIGGTYRLYRVNGTWSSTGSAGDQISRNIPFGKSVVTVLGDGFDGLYFYSADAANTNYNVVIEKLDTQLSKRRHHEKILLFGDSITEFSDNNNTNGQEAIGWAELLKTKNPSLEIFNTAVGGSAIRRKASPEPSSYGTTYSAFSMVALANAITANEYDWTPQDNAVAEYPNKAKSIAVAKSVNISKIDKVIILGGTNDWGVLGGNCLGSVSSMDETETLGALNVMISKLLTANNKLKIYIVSPPVQWTNDTFDEAHFSDNVVKSASNQSKKQFCESLRMVAERNHVQFIDLYNELGISTINANAFFPPSDGTHPKWGWREIAEYVYNRIW